MPGKILNEEIFKFRGVTIRRVPHNYIVIYRSREYFYPGLDGALRRVSAILLDKDILREDKTNVKTLMRIMRKHNRFFESYVKNFLEEYLAKQYEEDEEED